MSKYNIISPIRRYFIEEQSGIVTNASVEIDWSIELPFYILRNYAKKRGWVIIPFVETTLPLTFEFRGEQFSVRKENNRIVSINKIEDGEVKEITWSQLPLALKGLL